MAGESARAKAKRLRRSAEHWDRGTEAEEATATALMALPPSWTVLDDLAWPGRRFDNVDHVVIGPPGVFVIDTKSWSGRVTAENGALWQGRQDRSPAIWGAAAAARSVAGLVSSVRPDHVHAVVCLADADTGAAWVDDVLVCASGQLVRELTGHAEALPGGLASTIAADVGRHLRPADQPESQQLTLLDFASDPGRRRRPFATLVLVVLAVAAAVVLLSQPEALTSLVDDVSDWAVDLGT